MRYWVIAPYNSARMEIWNKVWEYDLSKGVIAIGWRELGDVSLCNEAQLRDITEQKYQDKNKAWKTWTFNSMWNFWHSIQIGDIILARKGRKCISGIGEVTQPAFYDEEMGYERVEKLTQDFYSNFVRVKWFDSPRNVEFDKQVFSFQTIYEIDKLKYNELTQGKAPADLEEKEIENQSEFILEKYLEEFIISNFDKIFKGKLVLYKDPEGSVAQQYATDIGKIDILAEETKTNSLIVIELKKGRESDKVVGQTLRYMGWVNENLCEENQKVRGIIICKEADEKLKLALKMINNIELKRYAIDFKLFSP